MKWLVLAICCVLTVEILFRSGFISKVWRLQAVYKKIISTLFNKNISDHWKEKVLPAYAWIVFKYSLLLFLYLLLMFSPFILAVIISNAFVQTFHVFLYSPLGLAAATIIAMCYAFIRSNYAQK